MLRFLFNTILTAKIVCNDAPQPWQIGFQDGGSPSFEGIVELHDQVMFYLIVILLGVGWMLSSTIRKFNSHHNQIVHKYLNHGTLIELIWTITPALVLIAIAFPSFKLLYLLDEVIDPVITVKAIGNQWFWTYEYSDSVNDSGDTIEFDSYMIPDTDLQPGQLRLLEVDNRVILPVDTHIRFIITARDVIHSFAVPSLGLKLDALPGRLNQTSVIINREGVYYGQCSELCGILHGFMPIVIESVSLESYLLWLSSQNSPPHFPLHAPQDLSRLGRRQYSTSSNLTAQKYPLNPWFITGFIEAEGCFDVRLLSSKSVKTGYSILCRFRVSLHRRDIVLLYLLQEYFQCGNIGKIDSKDCVTWTVADWRSLNTVIIPFFLQYPLRGTKYLDFLSFVQTASIIREKVHLTLEGVARIRTISASMNTGRTIIGIYQPEHTKDSSPSYIHLEPNYISGFVTGDGCFSLIVKEDSPNFGRAYFAIDQHKNNRALLLSLLSALNLTSNTLRPKGSDWLRISTTNRATIKNVILPFFLKYPLLGVKSSIVLKLSQILATTERSIPLGSKRIKWSPELRSKLLAIWNREL
jgi:cytochrome c oxidase subunit 2